MTPATAWVEGVLARLSERAQLSPARVEARFAHASGTYRGAPATLRSVAFEGPALRWVRWVSVLGEGLEIHNLLALPRPECAGPLLGIDLVDLGKPELIVVADASPPPGISAPALASSLPLAGPLPAWCARFFSTAPLFARVPKERFADVVQALEVRLDAVASKPVPHPDPSGHLAWQQAYLDAHRTEDRGLLLLGKLFGEDWAAPFLSDFLFPVRWARG